MQARHNPADWAGRTGQDFEKDHSAPDIDFATVHVWPDNWNKCAPAAAHASFQRIAGHDVTEVSACSYFCNAKNKLLQADTR